MPDQDNQPLPPRKKYRYTPWSIIAGLLGIPFGLSLGKLVGETLEWGKVATIAAECVITAAIGLVFFVAVNLFFGKEVELTEKKQGK
jgi:hypothetical protein